MIDSRTHHPRRRVHATPATLALLASGYAVRDLANALNVSANCASRYLSGHRRLPAHFPDALIQLVGEPTARQVLALIPPAVDRRLRLAA